MIVTFKPIVVPGNKRKDGTWAVYIRVTFKGVSRRLPTNIAAAPGDLTRTGRIKSASILERAGELVSRMRAALGDVTLFEMESWDVDGVVARIRDRLGAAAFRLDFFEWGDRYLRSKGASTRKTYDQALAALERFLGRRELDVNAINRTMLLEFIDFVNAEPKMHKGRACDPATETGKEKKPGAAASRHIQKLGHIYRAARDRYNDEDAGRIVIPRSPFDRVRLPIPPPSGGQRSIGAEAMQRVILASTDNPLERIALDAFVVSFCFMGANLADMWAAAPPSVDVWEYNRQKTRDRRADGALMRVTVPNTSAPFIARLRNGSARSSAFWFPALRRLAPSKDICTTKVNALLRRWAAREGLPDFTFYAARHTWATLARRAGVEKATVDECLGHVGDFALTDIYAERSWDLINAANAKVLTLFRWP